MKEKSLGQIAYETFHAWKGNAYRPWELSGEQNMWDAVARAVVMAVEPATHVECDIEPAIQLVQRDACVRVPERCGR